MSVLPSASVRGSLICHDGSVLPPAVSLRLFRQYTPNKAYWLDPDLRQGVDLALDKVILSGADSISFFAGSLEADVYHLALRPAGFALWTWAIGGEDRADAAPLLTNLGDTTDTGIVQIYCGPTIDVLPHVVSGVALPNLQDADVQVSMVPKESDPTLEAVDPEIEAFGDFLRLREFPEGELIVDITMNHPFFLPDSELSWTMEAEVEYGGLVRLTPAIEAIGGTLTVLGEGAKVVLSDDLDFQRESLTQNARTYFPSLPAGIYRVELCLDDLCVGGATVWEKVEIEAGEALTIRAH